MAQFGIYILTYPGDFHLSTSLIRSLRYFHPDIQIIIIPGEGFNRNDHPFDVDVLPQPGGFWATLGHQSRDFWAFQGPFDKFIYLDADILCTGSLKPVIERIDSAAGKFLFAHIYFDNQTWKAAIEDEEHAVHERAVSWVRRGLGNPELLTQFDAGYNPYARAPFNSGIFASRRNVITEDDLRALHEKEAAFYKDILKQEFGWKSCDLFYSDQGRLNYLVSKLDIIVHNLRPDGHDVWAGDITKRLTVDMCLDSQLEFKFIHWAGVPRPRPSIFCQPVFRKLDPLIYKFDDYRRYEGYPEIPGYSLWRHFQLSNKYPMRLKDQALFSYYDLQRLARSLKSKGRAWVCSVLKKTIGR